MFKSLFIGKKMPNLRPFICEINSSAELVVDVDWDWVCAEILRTSKRDENDSITTESLINAFFELSRYLGTMNEREKNET